MEGETQGRAALVERYRYRVWRIAMSLTGRESDSWDIAQEVFVKMMTRKGRFDSSAQFESWLYRVTHNVTMDHFRKTRRWKPLPETQEDPADEEAVVSGRMESKEARSDVQKVLAQLPPKYRTALVLREMEGESPEKIAKVFRIPEGLARWRVFRAREMFREIWERNYGRFED